MPPVFSQEERFMFVQNVSHAGQPRTSPCETHCLAGNAIQKMERAIADGDMDTALRSLRARNPFPGITGRVCPHPCEEACNRGRYDEALSIRALERYAADHGVAAEPSPLPSSGKSVAVVGSGPAGLSCAYFAALLGHAVTVLEAGPVAGGVPRQAIPDFRLPKAVVDREVGLVLGQGITLLTNTAVGRDISMRSLMERFDACVVAVGNARERRLALPGREKMWSAVDFLRKSNLMREKLDGRRVVILGGGGVALDAAFTARRLGAAEVALVFVEAREAMRVSEDEARQALEERVALHGSSLAVAVEEKENRVCGVTADRLTGFRFLDDGTLEAHKEKNGRFRVDADIVICASGLMADLDFLGGLPVELSARGFIRTDDEAMSSLPGLFAAGECATGPSLVASAVAAGRRAAFGADAWLRGIKSGALQDVWIGEEGHLVRQSAPATVPYEVRMEDIANVGHHAPAPRHAGVRVAAGQTWLAFEELDKGFSAEDSVAEAERCLHCGHCQNCGECVESCAGLILEKTASGPAVAYADECWHCGCCRLACPGGCIGFKFPLHTML